MKNTASKTPTTNPASQPALPRTLGSEYSFISLDYEDTGLAQLYMYRRTRTGYAMGAFFVDLRGVGILDSFGQLEMTREHYEDAVHENWHAPDLEPITPGRARAILQAGLKYSSEAERPSSKTGLLASPFLEGPLESGLEELLTQLASLGSAAPAPATSSAASASVEADAYQDALLDSKIAALASASRQVEVHLGRDGLAALLQSFVSAPSPMSLP
jgi:hypothetical protein